MPASSTNRCKAHSRTTDKQCGNAPINGTNVCRMHGGAAPQVKMKAEQRIREAADPAAAKIVSLMQNPKVPYFLQLAAARDLLDRAGISKTQTIGLEVRKIDDLISSGALLMDIVEPVALAEASLVGGEEVISLSDRDWEVRVDGPVPAKTVREKQRYQDKS